MACEAVYSRHVICLTPVILHHRPINASRMHINGVRFRLYLVLRAHSPCRLAYQNQTGK